MRRAIQFVKLDGLSVAEAASRCGMSESAVKVNVHRGLKALADAIARESRDMKTDDLIELLSTNVEPVDHRQVDRTFRHALIIAGAAVVFAVILALGVRGDVTSP